LNNKIIKTHNNDTIEDLDYSERWMRNGLSVVKPGDFVLSTELDMTQCKILIDKLQKHGTYITYTHIFVRATAIALGNNPELHQLISEKFRIIPGQVDIGLSVAGSTVVAPVMVIKNANGKSIEEIADEIKRRTPEVRNEQEKMLASIRKWGWLIPFGWLRRWILSQLISQIKFTRKGNGTFQVSCLSNVDQFVPFLFTTSAILGTGRVRERVIAINGKAEVRPTVIISCCANHKIWDGILAAKFLNAVKNIIEKGQF
jgi:pyruvate dehydrogenase E2 component (dihydrolipoamide acetyltransferase)